MVDLHVKYLAAEVRRDFSLASPEGTPDPEIGNESSASSKKMTYNELKEETIKQKRERNKDLLYQIMGNELLAEKDESVKKQKQRKNQDEKNAAESGPPKGANCE
jgi:hypothetical protein